MRAKVKLETKKFKNKSMKNMLCEKICVHFTQLLKKYIYIRVYVAATVYEKIRLG